MPNDHAASSSGNPVPLQPTRTGIADRFLLSVLSRRVEHLANGRLTLTLPGGTTATYKGRQPGRDVGLSISTYRAIWRMLRRGKLGFADSYLDGAIDADDLHALFHYVLDNESALATAGPSLTRASRLDRIFHASRDNTRAGSRRNIAAHYDLGNEFYRLWLDAGMTYSSGIYADKHTTLDAAQNAKFDAILSALSLEPTHTLLEIGCGWGGLIERAARRGARTTGITLSSQQLEWARDLVAGADLDDIAEIRFEDYRDTKGTYDRIASVEMIEAVGEAHWPAYFQILSDRLVDGGIAVIQAITIPEAFFEDYRRTPDFIQRYIFPGGVLPTEPAMQRCAEAAGLSYEPVDRFGACYARTLHDWRARFHDAWPQIRELGFDERFRRMWDYYLVYCAVGFERGTIDVGLYRFVKR